jgi:hypothetical protein
MGPTIAPGSAPRIVDTPRRDPQTYAAQAPQDRLPFASLAAARRESLGVVRRDDPHPGSCSGRECPRIWVGMNDRDAHARDHREDFTRASDCLRGEPYDLTIMNGEEGSGEEHRKRQPLGRVPVVQFDDGYVFESAAICLHLADVYPDAGLIGRQGTYARAHGTLVRQTSEISGAVPTGAR